MGRKPSSTDDWLIYRIPSHDPATSDMYYVVLPKQAKTVWKREHDDITNRPVWSHARHTLPDTLAYMINKPRVYTIRLVTKATHPYVNEVIRELETVLGTQS